MSSPPPIRQVGLVDAVRLGMKRRLRPISYHQLPSVTLRNLRLLPDDELLHLAQSRGLGSVERLTCDVEIKRREGRTARLALAISFLSLVVSVASAVLKG